MGLRATLRDLTLRGVISFGRKGADPGNADERPHGYKPGFGHASYCLALLPSGIHCGRKEMDPIHTVDDRNAIRNAFRRSG